MARSGIYVNGKEIVARYIGDKKVWEKTRVSYVISFSTWNQRWSTNIPTLEGTISERDSIKNGRYSNIKIRMGGKMYTIDNLEVYDSTRYSWTKEFTIEFAYSEQLQEFKSFYSSAYKIEILM